MADRHRTSPPQRLSAWMRAHYDELRPEQPFDAKWVGERVRELGITDRAGKPPSRSALTVAWYRERQRRKAQAATAPAPAAVVIPEYRPPEPPPRRIHAVVNPVVLGAPVTTEKHQFRLAKMKGGES